MIYFHLSISEHNTDALSEVTALGVLDSPATVVVWGLRPEIWDVRSSS